MAILEIRDISGLSESQAAQRLKEEGSNELPRSRRHTVLAIALEVLHEPIFLMLVACGLIYLLMGPDHIRDALMLLGFVFVVLGITIYQKRRTERTLEALRDLSSPRALVTRDGIQRRIAGREVVRGDIIILGEGDRVPADAVLRRAMSFSVDESLLTGESEPVRKGTAADISTMGPPGGEDLPFVYSGTMVTRGHGVAEVLATGMRTELGKIGKAVESVEPERTLLERETGSLVRNLALVGISLSVLVVIVYGLTRGGAPGTWEQGFLAGITMAMAIIPEEFPVVLTIFLALGAWRISQSHVLTRHMPAVETLGAATVLCADKTGTLTLNQMSIGQLFANGHFFDLKDPANVSLPEKFHELLEFGILASKRDPFDPMEKALRQLGDEYLARTEHIHDNWTLESEYPLSAELLALSHVWRSPDGMDFVIACKGAPEAIGDLCHFSGSEMNDLSHHAAMMADEGLRVLGVAKAHFKHGELPEIQHDFQFSFVGLVGLADPVRPAVVQSIKECCTAGIRVIMITGDYPKTARNIAARIGLSAAGECITGPELARTSDEELMHRIRNVNIFARVVPEQKLRIVTALKANHEIVAMTGDGVNDAPALKAAHIGVAMGGHGTDVAREASALVLLDDDFSSIVEAVRLGRRIFDNIKKAVSYIIGIHVPIVGLSMVPVFLKGWPLILLPVHVLFLELIIDPACSIIFEAEEAELDVMNRPPRNPKDRLFSMQSIAMSILQGVSVLAIALAVFAVARFLGHSDDTSRALTFTTLVIANLCLILTNRSWFRTILSMFRVPNRALWWVVGGALVFMALVLCIPFLRHLFHFGEIHAIDLAVCLAAGVLSVLWFELLKVFRQFQRA